MTNAERAERLKEAIKHLSGAVSAFQHGRRSTALEKLDVAHAAVEAVDFDCYTTDN